MAKHKIVYVKRDEQKNAVEACVLYEGLEICYIPDHSIKDGKEEKKVKEVSRVYIFGGEYTPEKMKIRVESDELKIHKQVWAIFYEKKKKSIVKEFFIPNEDRLIEEATLLNNEVDIIKKSFRKKSFTDVLEIILKSKTESITLNPQNNYMSYAQKKILFDFNKVGLLLTKEGWIIINRREGGQSFKNVVFDIDSAVRMQDHILDSYIGEACSIIGEIPRVKELIELTRRINNLLIDWENSKKNKTNLKSKINALIEELSGYRNDLKNESKELLKSFSDLKDSRGQENPGAFAAKTIAMINRLEDRLAQIRDITPVIERRKKIINDTKDLLRTEKMLAEKGLIELLKTNNFSYYSANGTNQIIINKLIHALDCLTIEPFASRKMQVTFYLQVAKSHIIETKKAKKYLRQALVILQS